MVGFFTVGKVTSQVVAASSMEPAGWPTVNTKASILLSQSAAACSADCSSDARAKSLIFQPIASITTSNVPHWPDHGLPPFTPLPFRSSTVLLLASLRSTTVQGSGGPKK